MSVDVSTVQLFSVRESFVQDPDLVRRKLLAVGIGAVELFGLGGLGPDADTVRALSDGGLGLAGAHAQFIVLDDEGVLRRDEVERVVALAADLGLTELILPRGPGAPGKIPPADYVGARLAALINEAVPIAQTYGISLGYHNHWWEFTESGEGGRPHFYEFVDALDSEAFLEVDTYWAASAGVDVPQLLRQLGTRVRKVHLKDGGFARDGSGQVPLGDGGLAVESVLDATAAEAVIEFDRYDGDVFEAIRRSADFLRNLEERR
ncbi:MAG: sugar phosphate isomerase/epimerase [Gordonia sp. (in: high G+C Gram-positive bacteria)]